jgi:hypothetical protein
MRSITDCDTRDGKGLSLETLHRYLTGAGRAANHYSMNFLHHD